MAKDTAVEVTPKGVVNARMTLEGDELVIRVKIKERHGDSKSGITTRISSTLGNKKISVAAGEEVTVGLNVYIPK